MYMVHNSFYTAVITISLLLPSSLSSHFTTFSPSTSATVTLAKMVALRRSSRLAASGAARRSAKPGAVLHDAAKKDRLVKVKATGVENQLMVSPPSCPMRSKELQMMQEGCFTHVIGVDEVGRGCLAGPVCAGAYCLPVVSESKVNASFLINRFIPH